MTKKPFLKVGIITGEASGDLLGASLVAELKKYYETVEIEGVLGPKLQALGGKALYEMETLSIMGFVEPLKQLPSLFSMRSCLIKHFIKSKPDVFIGIDSPDFNLGVEKKLKAAGIKTVHYVSPSVWAWRKGRMKTIKKAVDLMLTLLPFEKSFYDGHKVAAEFVGHPLADQIPLEVNQLQARESLALQDKPTLAILPGSRLGELEHLAPLYLEIALQLKDSVPELQVLVPLASDKVAKRFFEIKRQVAGTLEVLAFSGQAQTVMQASDVVLLTSGTATLEAMLCKRPMVVAYKTSRFNAWVARNFIDIKYFSLPNLLFNKPLVPEYFQEAATVKALLADLLRYFSDEELRQSVSKQFAQMHQQLRMSASVKAAAAVMRLVV